MKNRKNNQQGFTLMVAMLVSTIIIVVGLGVSSIVLRQFNLAVLGRESQSAFYAADTMVECIFYWDLQGGVFGSFEAGDTGALNNLPCDNTGGNGELDKGNITIDIIPQDPLAGTQITPCAAGFKVYKTYTTNLIVESSLNVNLPVAYALITRSESCVPGDDITINTKIDVNGYNSSRSGDPRRVERGLSLTY